MPVWKGNGNGLAKIIGNKFWIAPESFPIRIGRALVKVEFKGYRKVKDHPEFHYTVNGLDVFERITALPSGLGLTRHFRIPDVRQPVYFQLGQGEIDSAANTGVAVLPAEKARAFIVTHRHHHRK